MDVIESEILSLSRQNKVLLELLVQIIAVEIMQVILLLKQAVM